MAEESYRRTNEPSPLEVEPSIAGASGADDLEEKDVLLPPQRLYAMAVNQAQRKYQEAVANARSERQKAIDEALHACILAMEED